MERLPTSSRRAVGDIPTWFIALVCASGVFVGIASERAAYAWSDVRHWMTDLVVGLTVLGAGVSALSRRRLSGLLLIATASGWFLGNFSGSLAYLHRGPLVHLVVTYPTGRPRRPVDVVAVSIGYLASLTGVIWDHDNRALIAAIALLVLVAAQRRAPAETSRRDRTIRLALATIFTSTLIAVAVIGLAPTGANDARQYVYSLGVATVALVAVGGARRSSAADVTDLIVELGEGSTGTLPDALGAALGDPTLVIGYPSAGGEYVDESGRRVPIPAPGGQRKATFLGLTAQPVAVLVHDASVPTTTTLMEAIATMTELVSANVALLEDVRRQTIELTASRRRLLVAADDERRRLERRLHRGAERRVAVLERRLREALDNAKLPADQHLRRAVDQLAITLGDLRALAEGLRPRELDGGLGAAIGLLAERCPVPVRVCDDSGDGIADEVSLAVYFVVAEALTNVVKHADARSVEVSLQRVGGDLVLVIADDGVGGAAVSLGTGLRGLIDRVEALGGTLGLTSVTGHGTRLRVTIPLGSVVG